MKKEYTILLLGTTGVGKSTWINGIRNYFEYKTFQDALSGEPKVLIPVSFSHTSRRGVKKEVHLGEQDENERQETGKSATKFPRTYVLEQKDYILNLIDTPGVGDTELRDTINMETILSHLSDFKEIHAICILLKPDESRLTTWFKYCTKELLHHLHKDAAQNIKFCFTRTRTTNYGPGSTIDILKKLLEELKIDLLETEDSFERSTFYFDNEAFMCLARQSGGIAVTKKEQKLYENSWDQSVEETLRLFGETMKLKGHSTERTISLNRARDIIIRISEPLANISVAIDKTIDESISLKKKAETLDLKTTELSYELYLKVSLVKKIEIGQPRTVCTHESCVTIANNERGEKQFIYKVCCDPCYLGSTLNYMNFSIGTKKDRRLLYFCWSMSVLNETCKICQHCYKDHKHITHDYETFEKSIINEKTKKSLQENKSLLDSNKIILEEQGKLLKELTHEREYIISAITEFVYFLKENSILPYNNSFIEHINLIERNEELLGNRNHDQIQRLKKLKQDYEQLEKTLAQCNLIKDAVTAKTVFEIEANLYKLKNYGDAIKSCMEHKEPPLKEDPKTFFGKVWSVAKQISDKIFDSADSISN